MKEVHTRGLIKLYKRKGSKKALEVLVRNHQNAMWKIAGTLPDSPLTRAEKVGIANEALTLAASKFDLRHKIPFLTYVMTMAKFKILDAIRVELKKKAVSLESVEYKVGNNGIDIEEEDTAKFLHAKISELPRTEQIVTACVLQGMSVKDIASQTDVSVQVIYRIYNRAKDELKSKLQGEYYNDISTTP